MTQKRVKASDVIGNSYYIYTLESSNNTPTLNGTINITCNVTDVYGQAVSGKSITLYQNSTSKGAKTTDSNGNASWNSISMGSAGLQTFKVENSKIEVFVDNKSDVGHTHSQYLTEHQSLSNYVTTTDSRLSDARTPTSHTHGNLQNDGQVGSSAQANKNVVTNSSGKITTEDKPTIPSASSIIPSADTNSGAVGTGTTWARADHKHPKSTLYAEASHDHTTSDITNFPTLHTVATSGSYNDLSNKPNIPSKTSDLSNDSGFLTSHQDISGKIDTAGTGLSKSETTLNHSNSVTALTTASFKKVKYDGEGHITGATDVSASDLPSHNHTKSQITDFPTIPSKTSELTNDSGFLTSHQSLSGYLQTSDVKDNLTSTDTNKPLSALQGKELKALIDAKEDNIEIFTGSVDRVNSTSAFLKAYTTSSILEGKIILYKVPDISSIEQTTNVALDYYMNNQTTSFYRKYVYKNGVQLTFGDVKSNSWILLAYDGTLTNGQWNLISSSSYAEANHTHTIDLNSFDFYNADNWRTFDGNAPTISSDSIQANAVSHHILNKEFLESKYYTLTFEFNTASSRSGLYLFGDKDCNRMFEITTDIGNTFILQYDSNGNTTELYAGTKNHFTSGWHNIKVIRKGDTAIVYIDDELYYSFNNIGNCTNIFGLFKWSLYSVTIKNIDVSLDVTELPIDDLYDTIETKIDKLQRAVTTFSPIDYVIDEDGETDNNGDVMVLFDGASTIVFNFTDMLNDTGDYFEWELGVSHGTIYLRDETNDDEIWDSSVNSTIRIRITKNEYSDSYHITTTDLSTNTTLKDYDKDYQFDLTFSSMLGCTFYFSNMKWYHTVSFIDMIYPIGSIYMSINSINPSLFIGGEWEQLKDRFLLGSGDTYANGSTGGSATVTLTSAQSGLKAHGHGMAHTHNHRHSEHGNWSTGSGSSSGYMYSSSRAVSTQYTGYDNTASSKSTTDNNTASDASEAHENMPPYLTVYMWKRIA